MKRLDIIVWGATGFTGGMICEYLATNYPPHKATFKWAIAGRNFEKLDQVKKAIVSINPACKDIEILVADSNSEKSLDEVLSQTKVVIAAAGPFGHFGTQIVDSCIRSHTHYCDITGETPWVKKMIEKHSQSAKEKNLFFVPMSAFESTPSDLGAFMMVDHAKNKYSDTVKNVELFFTFKPHAFVVSGGTLRSILYSTSIHPLSKTDEITNPNTLITNGAQIKANSDKPFWTYDKDFKLYHGVSPMGATNRMVIHRSASILNYGPQFSVNEYWTHGPIQSFLIILGGILLLLICKISFLRNFLLGLLPAVGKGPDKEKLKSSSFRVYLKAVTTKGKSFKGYIQSEGDSGYIETSKMVSEMAICLALYSESKLSSGIQGGFYTPASLFGNTLIERLNKANLIFKVDE